MHHRFALLAATAAAAAVAALSVTAAPAAEAPQVSVVEGVWVGGEEGQPNLITLYFSQASYTFIDSRQVVLGTWKLGGAGERQGEAWVYPFDATVHASYQQGGQHNLLPQKPATPLVSLGTVWLQGDKARMCVNVPGSKAPRIGLQLGPNDRGNPRCFNLRRYNPAAWPAPK